MITLDNLTYTYHPRARKALDEVTCQIGPGIHLLLGENGAGKTTLLRLIAGLLTPKSGSCAVDGESTARRLPAELKRLFMLPDSMEIPATTICGFAKIHSRFYPTFSVENFEMNLEEFGVTGRETFRNLSLGLRRKSLLAFVTALGVDVLLLDEPANGLDINSKHTLRRILARTTAPDRTVIISTHTISDLRELFDGVILLSQGRLILSQESWRITERISFVSSAVPPAASLFFDQSGGVFRSIVPNTDGEAVSEVNYDLLYTALTSPARDTILSLLESDVQPPKFTDNEH